MSRGRSRRRRKPSWRCIGAARPAICHRLSKVARAHALPIVEDAALAFGATYEGRRIGSISDYTCFSFQATKHVTTVDGGALTCASAGRAGARPPPSLVRRRPDRHAGVALGSGHSGGRLQVPHERRRRGDRPGAIETRRAQPGPATAPMRRAYDEALQDCAGIQPLRLDAGAVGSYWTYTVRVAAREAFMKHMTGAGIGVPESSTATIAIQRSPLPARHCRAWTRSMRNRFRFPAAGGSPLTTSAT